jgi:predicted polyphosphate/ATP-dependent NAD kinase
MMSEAARLRVGLLINPYAGVGGPLAMKGSDGMIAKALAAGIIPQATRRAENALRAMELLWPRIDWFTGSGALGEDLLHKLGLAAGVIYGNCRAESGRLSDAVDSVTLASRLTESELDLIIFAGGDGTARDVLKGMQKNTPMIGIPAGVKMQSAVFGVSPVAAGLLALDFLEHSRRITSEMEVMDLDETLLRQEVVAPILFGYMTVPVNSRFLQGKKMRTPDSDASDVSAIAHRVSAELTDGITYLIGPGSTTYSVKNKLRLDGSLLGVDIIRDRKMLQRDATEPQIWDALERQTCRVLLSCIGGQGHVIGRGNSQISPRILQQLDPTQLTVLATPGKLQSLRGRAFQIDSGDAAVDARFSQPVRVYTGFDDDAWYRIQATGQVVEHAASI